MQVCAFFFFNTKERKRFVPPSPALRPVHGGKQSPCSAPPGPRPPASGRRNPPRSPGALAGQHSGRPVATSLPVRRCPPSPALGRGPCRDRPRHPGLPGALMLLECGRRGPRVLGNLRARQLTAPAPAGLARGGAGNWGAGHSRVPTWSSPRPPHLPAKREKGSSNQ